MVVTQMCVSIKQQIFYNRILTSGCIYFFPFIFLLVRVACKSTAVLISALYEKGKKRREKMTMRQCSFSELQHLAVLKSVSIIYISLSDLHRFFTVIYLRTSHAISCIEMGCIFFPIFFLICL